MLDKAQIAIARLSGIIDKLVAFTGLGIVGISIAQRSRPTTGRRIRARWP
jgi:hypothetical protein